jgi:hypothetical protein
MAAVQRCSSAAAAAARKRRAGPETSSVSTHGADWHTPNPRKGVVVQGLSPARELRVMERLPHSEQRCSNRACPQDTVFSFRRGNGGGAAVQPWMASRVGGRVSGRRRGVNWERGSFQPEMEAVGWWSGWMRDVFAAQHARTHDARTHWAMGSGSGSGPWVGPGCRPLRERD